MKSNVTKSVLTTRVFTQPHLEPYMIEPALPVSKEKAQHIALIARLALKNFRDEQYQSSQ